MPDQRITQHYKALDLEFYKSLYGLLAIIIAKIRTLGVRAYLFFAIIVLTLGILLGAFYYYPNYIFYQLMLVCMIIITLHSTKEFFKEFSELKVKVAADPRLSALYHQTKTYQESPLILFGALLFITFYVSCIFLLGYLKVNVIGIYALLLIFITCASGAIGFGEYIVMIIYFFRLTKTKISLYNYYYPAHTDWLKAIAKLARRISNTFFVLGLMYTTIWIVIIPQNAVKIISGNGKFYATKIILSTCNDTVFIASWIGIFLFFIGAFPALAMLHRTLIKKIVKKLKENTVSELQLLLNAAISSGNTNIDNHIKYLSLIKEVEATPNFPLETTSYLPAITTITSLIIQLIKIGESFS